MYVTCLSGTTHRDPTAQEKVPENPAPARVCSVLRARGAARVCAVACAARRCAMAMRPLRKYEKCSALTTMSEGLTPVPVACRVCTV